MDKLRVLILCNGHVVDSHAFDDPRQGFIKSFQKLNGKTPYRAVCEELFGDTEIHRSVKRADCRHHSPCRGLHD